MPAGATGRAATHRGRCRKRCAREIWQRLFARHYHVFRATPSRLWLDSVFAEIFGMQVQLTPETADDYFDAIQDKLRQDSFSGRARCSRPLCIEVLATTESPLDELIFHRALRESSWPGRVITTFRPDPVLDPQHETFRENLGKLSQITDRDAFNYGEYLQALRDRRQVFAAAMRAPPPPIMATPSAATADLSEREAQALFRRVTTGVANCADAEQFRAHMLTVMAGMSLDDGLVMQIHPGAWRNHNAALYARFRQ